MSCPGWTETMPDGNGPPNPSTMLVEPTKLPPRKLPRPQGGAGPVSASGLRSGMLPRAPPGWLFEPAAPSGLSPVGVGVSGV